MHKTDRLTQTSNPTDKWDLGNSLCVLAIISCLKIHVLSNILFIILFGGVGEMHVSSTKSFSISIHQLSLSV